MTLDPVVGVVVGALVTVAGLFYRNLLAQLAEEKAETKFWRDRALNSQALAEIAVDKVPV